MEVLLKQLVLREHATAAFSTVMIISMEESGVSEILHFIRSLKVCVLDIPQ